MTPNQILNLEKLLIKSHKKNLEKGYDGPFQIGGYVISPIYWGEQDDEITIDTETMLDEFHDTLQYLDTDFAK
jgi:hypothetical protein